MRGFYFFYFSLSFTNVLSFDSIYFNYLLLNYAAFYFGIHLTCDDKFYQLLPEACDEIIDKYVKNECHNKFLPLVGCVEH